MLSSDPSQTRKPNRAFLPMFVEGVFLVSCLCIVWSQSRSYPTPKDDPDPDGYTSYSERLQEGSGIDKEYRRYPGYPAVIMASRLAFGTSDPCMIPGTLHEPIHMLQSILCIVFSIILYFAIRLSFGILESCMCILILSMPNFLVLYTSYPFPGFIYSILWALCFWYLSYWVRNDMVFPNGTCIALLAVLVFLMQLIKPNATTVLALFSIFVILSGLLAHTRISIRLGIPTAAKKAALIKGGVLLAIALSVALIVPAFFGTGPLQFASKYAKMRLVLFLPPASDSQVEMEIEAAKSSFEEKTGLTIVDENFNGGWVDIPAEQLEKVWMQRLLAHPIRYLLVILEECRRKHFLTVDAYIPFEANTGNGLYVTIEPKSNTPESRLYRATGLWVPRLNAWQVCRSIARLLLFWSIVAIGAVRLYKNSQIFVISTIGCVILYILLCATIAIDPRYLLVFAAPLYVTQAIGVSVLVRWFFRISRLSKVRRSY